MTTIEATICNLDELRTELAEIDENLIRNELTATERGIQTKRRKEIHEAIYPETKRGTAGAIVSNKTRHGKTAATPKIGFVADTAKKSGVSVSTVKNAITSIKRIPQPIREKIRNTPIANRGTDLDKLSRMKPDEQEKVVDRIVSGKAKTVAEAKRRRHCP